MSSALIFVIGVLWPAILAALVVEWVKGLVRGPQRRERLDREDGAASDGSGRWREAGERRSFEVRLSLVVRRIQQADERPSEPGGNADATVDSIRFAHPKG